MVEQGVAVVEQGVVVIQTQYTTRTHRLDRGPVVLGVLVINLL